MQTLISAGGPFMVLLAGYAFAALMALLVQQLVIKTRRLAGLAPAVFGGLLCLGVAGFLQSFLMLIEAVSHAAPAQKELLFSNGMASAAVPLLAAMVLIAALSPLSLAARIRDSLGAPVRAERRALGFAMTSPAVALVAFLSLVTCLSAFVLTAKGATGAGVVNTALVVGLISSLLGAALGALGMAGSGVGALLSPQQRAALEAGSDPALLRDQRTEGLVEASTQRAAADGLPVQAADRRQLLQG